MMTHIDNDDPLCCKKQKGGHLIQRTQKNYGFKEKG